MVMASMLSESNWLFDDRKCCSWFPVYRDELILITPNEIKFRSYRSKPVEDWIRDEPVILREEGSGTRTEAINYLQKIGIDLKDLHIAAQIGNTRAILQAVKKGLGITFLSRLAAEEDLRAGHVLGFPFSGEGCYRAINLIFNSSFPPSEGANRLIRYVKTYYEFSEAVLNKQQ